MARHDPINHYEYSDLLEKIVSTLADQDIDLEHLTRQNIKGFDEFHLQGANISEQLAKKLQIRSSDHILDLGCGIGGASRMLSDVYGCHVTGIDITPSYIETASALTKWVGLDHKIKYVEGSVLQLPFPDAHFDLVWTQHVQMNVQDKRGLYHEVSRVLKGGGQFLYYDIFSGQQGDALKFPVPWAEVQHQSFLMFHQEMKTFFDSGKWIHENIEDHTLTCLQVLEETLATRPGSKTTPLNLGLLMRNSTREKLENLLDNLKNKRIEVHSGIFRKKTAHV